MRGFMKILLIAIISASSAFGSTIIDPLKYAKKVAKEYSKGDSNRVSQYSCDYNIAEETAVGGDLRIVDCEGKTSILVHGGHMVTVQFACRMTFEPISLMSEGYQVTFESCH